MFERWNNRRTRDRFNKFFPESGMKTLIEIGVWSVSLLRYMQGAGFEVSGCDLSKTICRHLENNFGIHMHNCSVSYIQHDAYFDLIIMNHALENVENPINFLEVARSKIEPRGFLHVAVPNVSSWEAMLRGWVVVLWTLSFAVFYTSST